MLLGIRWRSLGLKIFAWAFVPAAIILGAVALLIFFAYQQVTADLVLERNQEVARLAAVQLNAELGGYADILAGLTRTADLYRADPTAQQAALERAADRLRLFDGGVVVLNADGKVVAAMPLRSDVLGANWSDRAYFQQAQQSTGPVFSNIVNDGPNGQAVVALAVPIIDEQGRFQGKLVGFFRLGQNSFNDSIVTLNLESGSIYLVDGQNRLIYHPNPALIGGDISNQPVVEQAAARRVYALRTQGLEGADIVASFAPVPGTPWGLVTEESWSTLFGASQWYRFFLLFMLALGIIVPALVVMAGARRLTQPINDMIEASQAVAAGNFNKTISVNTGDELEELANQFNRMAEQLQRWYRIMQQRVAGRTQALSTINAISAVVSASVDLTETLEDALDKTLEITGTEAGGVFQLDDSGSGLTLMTHCNLSPEMAAFLQHLPLAAGPVSERAIRKGHPVIRPVADFPAGEWRTLLEAEGWQRVAGIPLIAKGKSLGTISLFTRFSETLFVEHIQLLAAIGQQIGIALENAQLYEQAQQLAMAEERQRLARDLHDSVTQALYGVTLYAEAASRLLSAGDTEQAAENLDDLRETAQEALREIRLLIYELRPLILEEQGLVAALGARLESVESRSGLRTAFEFEERLQQQRLPLDMETGLYRIAQEALNNILKHAHAGEVRVRLLTPDNVVLLEIADDGHGFDPANGAHQGRLGLHTMRERATLLGGRLAIDSRPGDGTRIKVEVTR
jgi:nitrate/nitrite-specific signal transduction histidine kinase